MGASGSLWTQLLEKIKWLAVPAVDTFFVLSGFCLMYSLERKAFTAVHVSQFLTKRIFRIYPTYLAAVFFAFLCKELFYTAGPLPAISEWFQKFWSSTITLRDMIDHVVLILPFNSSKLNPVIWTLSVEMRMSLMFPVIAGLLRAGSGIRDRVILLIVCLGVIGLPVEYLSYFPLFALGAAVAKYRDSLTRYVPRSLWLSMLILTAPGLLLVGLRSTLYPGIMAQARFVHLAIGLFSAYLILLSTVNPELNAFFQRAPILFLGKISYSFYLLHFPLLLSVSLLLAGHAPISAIWGIALAVALTVAWLSYRYVEMPSQCFGQRVSGRLERLDAVCGAV